MRKLITMTLALMLACAATSHAQWTFAGYFPDTTYRGASGAHGIAVDPAGKIWTQIFGVVPGDSIQDATSGLMRGVLVIRVWNPDGTEAAFSPIKTITVGGTTDTLYTGTGLGSNRGLRADHNGNILVSFGATATAGGLYRINYLTGAGMNKVVPQATSLTAVAVDTLGEIFVGKVVPNNPLQILDADFNILGNVTDSTIGFSRSFEVSADGNDVYWAGYTNHAIYRYHSDNGSFGPYVLADTLLKGFDSESFAWNPTRTRLWLSAGSANDRPNRFPGETTNYSLNTWYAYDPTSGLITDSIKWNFWNTDSANTRPRAIAFSPDGNTAYVGCFGSGAYPAIEKFTRTPTSVTRYDDAVPERFTLLQNYPNPFNPTTEIRFTLTKAGFTTLVVHDMLGREVATLVSEQLSPGSYSATFNASGVSSGTYIYTLTSEGVRLSKKMMLMK